MKKKAKKPKKAKQTTERSNGASKPTKADAKASKRPASHGKPPKAADEGRSGMVAAVKKGRCSDAHPLDDVQYLDCKLILKGDRFTSVESFYDFAKLVKRAAKNADVGFSTKGFKGARPQIREVLLLDTEDYKLCNNAFILRWRMLGNAPQAHE